MKKIVLFVILFFNIIPYLHKGRFLISGPCQAFAQYNGGSEQNIDQCDENSSNYDPSACEQATCDPGSVNYDVDQCDMQSCDESSTNYDPSQCEYSTCDPDNINYDVDQCDMQDCDDTSVNYNPSQCEYDTCDPDNVNYDVDECDMQDCDDTSVNYNPSQCEYDTCDPDNVNYDVDQCDMQDCDDTSVNYNPSQCEYDTCDPDNVNYDIDQCDMQKCDDTSVNFDPTECEYATCDPDNVNYNPAECAAQKCDPTSVNYNPQACNCPCLKNLPTTATGGLLRNKNGDVIRSIGSTTGVSTDINHPERSITFRDDYVYAANGSPIPTQVILSVTVNGVDRPDLVPLSTTDCLGYAIGDDHSIIDAGQTTSINDIMGIGSIPDAISNGTYRSDFQNIQTGQVLLILSATGYVHAAVYDTDGYYYTRNGTGNEITRSTLADIQAIYYLLGGVSSVFANAPPKPNSTSNLGLNTGGIVNMIDVANAVSTNCDCNTNH